MIVDADELRFGQAIETDLCIVGGGAAGITIALEFRGSPYRVTVLEGGGDSLEPASQEPYRSEVVGLPHGGIHQGRARAFGGTTWLWAGQCLPLIDVDFTHRDWVPHSGWPFPKSELASYYPRAEQVMEVPHASYDPATWPAEAVPPVSPDLAMFYSQFTARPNFRDKYGRVLREAGNVTVVTHATTVALTARPRADSVAAAEVRSHSGRTIRVGARCFIVCCGGIESARLLLASNSVDAAGIGNRHDVVGRYFQDHPGVGIPIRVLDAARFRSWYNSFAQDGIRYAIKTVASTRMQQEQQILNVGSEVYYPPTEADPVDAAKLVLKAVRHAHLRKEVPRAIKAMSRRPDRVVRAAFRHYVLHQPANVGATKPFLGIGVEQAPNPDSRITLSRERDSFNVPRAKLDWRLTDRETRSIAALARAIQGHWSTLGLAELQTEQVPMAGRELGEFGGYVDANHHMGTTRMGTDPLRSVVDPDCKVHDYDNLYIASSSVFPTCGFSNPTLTVLALCLRLCDRLKQVLPSRPAAAVQPAESS